MQIDFVQRAFPDARIYNVWNWFDIVEESSKVAVFLVDFLTLHDSSISERCHYLFTCAYSNKRLYSLGHKTAYAGAGVCEVSSLLSKALFTKTLQIGIFWSPQRLESTTEVCKQLGNEIFQPGSQKDQFLKEVLLHSEPIPYLTVLVAIIAVLVPLVIVGISWMACLLIKKSHMQKFAIAAALDYCANNNHYAKFIVAQTVIGSRDMRTIYENSRSRPFKYKSLVPQRLKVSLRIFNQPSVISDTDVPGALAHHQPPPSQPDQLPRRFRYHGSALKGCYRESRKIQRPLSPPKMEKPSKLNVVFSNTASSMLSTRHEPGHTSEKPSFRTMRQSSSKKLGSLMSSFGQGGNANDESDISIIDNITLEDQRRICSSLPQIPNIIQGLPSELRYFSSFSLIEEISFDQSALSQISVYNGKTILFSRVPMPIWASASIFSSIMELQRNSDANKKLFAPIEGVFIYVKDATSGRQYILPKEFVNMCAMCRSNSYYLCMITNLENYKPLKTFSQGIKTALTHAGLGAASFRHNTNFVYEVLSSCGRLIKEKQEAEDLRKHGQVYPGATLDLDADEHLPAPTNPVSSGDSTAKQVLLDTSRSRMSPSFTLSEDKYCIVPPIKKLQKMSSQSLMDLFAVEYFLLPAHRVEVFIRVLHELNAQRPSQHMELMLPGLYSHQDHLLAELTQKVDENSHEKLSKMASRSESRGYRITIHKNNYNMFLRHYGAESSAPRLSNMNRSSNINSNVETTLPSCALTRLHSTENSSVDYDYNDDAGLDDQIQTSVHRLEEYLRQECVNTTPLRPGEDSIKHTISTPLFGVEYGDTQHGYGDLQYRHQADAQKEMLPELLNQNDVSKTSVHDSASHRQDCPDTHSTLGSYTLSPSESIDDQPCKRERQDHVYDLLSRLGSSARERVIRVLLKGLAGHSKYLRTIRYFDSDCILLDVNPFITEHTIDAEVHFKLEPFSILLRKANLVPRQVLNRTNYNVNSPDVDMYSRLILIYLEFVTLLDCTQEDIEDFSALLSEHKADRSYGDAVKLLLLLTKGFAKSINTQESSGRWEEDISWTELLFKTFQRAND